MLSFNHTGIHRAFHALGFGNHRIKPEPAAAFPLGGFRDSGCIFTSDDAGEALGDVGLTVIP